MNFPDEIEPGQEVYIRCHPHASIPPADLHPQTRIIPCVGCSTALAVHPSSIGISERHPQTKFICQTCPFPENTGIDVMITREQFMELVHFAIYGRFKHWEPNK